MTISLRALAWFVYHARRHKSALL